MTRCLCCIGIVLLALFFSSGCAAKKELLNEIDTKIAFYGASMLCGQIQDIKILDKRSGVDQKNIKIPLVSRPGLKDEIRPLLTPQLELLILDELTHRSLETGKKYSLNVHILEGLQRFEASWTAEKEYVNWKIEMLLQSPQGTATATSDTEYFASSIDASHGYISKLYIKTLRLSILSAFSKAIQLIPNYDASCRSSI